MLVLRGDARRRLGLYHQRPSEDRFLLVESDPRNRITVLMGGRAAEGLVLAGNVSTGAADDLQRPIEIALEIVTRQGMAETVGQRTYASLPHSNHPFSRRREWNETIG
jgi:cell division protease FtsH